MTTTTIKKFAAAANHFAGRASIKVYDAMRTTMKPERAMIEFRSGYKLVGHPADLWAKGLPAHPLRL